MRARHFAPVVAMIAMASTSASFAQLQVGGDLLDNCANIDSLQSSGNFSAARDAARLCLEGIEQELVGEIGQFFMPQIGAWTRTDYQENNMMGFNNITATYEKGNIEVDVSLTGQAGGGGGPLGGLGGLIGGIASSAMLQNGQQVTVAGIPSSIQPDGSLTVPLQDGSFLTFTSSDLDTPDEAIAGMGDLINDFPVADINAALQ